MAATWLATMEMTLGSLCAVAGEAAINGFNVKV